MIAAEKGAEGSILGKKEWFRGGVELPPSVPCSPFVSSVWLSKLQGAGAHAKCRNQQSRTIGDPVDHLFVAFRQFRLVE